MIVSRNLLQLFANKIHLQYGVIKTAIFNEEYLRNLSEIPVFAPFRNETDSCILLGDCQPLLGKLESIGENLQIKIKILAITFKIPCQSPG